MLLNHFYEGLVEAGCDEAGRGPLAGPVYAAAVILPDDYENEMLNDSKKLTEKKRYQLREVIEKDALAWAVGIVTAEEIDHINILNASILAMHRAIDQLKVRPQALIIDGNRFKTYYETSPNPSHFSSEGKSRGEKRCEKRPLPHTTIVKGDGKYLAIAAASILAKTYRDDYMKKIGEEYPQYQWAKNKGYPTKAHYEAIHKYGPSPYHRLTFAGVVERQLELFPEEVNENRLNVNEQKCAKNAPKI